MQTEKDYVKDLGTVVEVSWSKPCYAKCFLTNKYHSAKWQQQKIQHEKKTGLFRTLLPWSPSHVDRNKKKCLRKLFLFPSNKCCILGFNSSMQRFFLATLLLTNSAVMQPWGQWERIIYAPSIYFIPFLLSCSDTTSNQYWTVVAHTSLEFALGLQCCVWVVSQSLASGLCWGVCVANGPMFWKKKKKQHPHTLR